MKPNKKIKKNRLTRSSNVLTRQDYKREALRYFNNAKTILTDNTKIEYGRYDDTKYVRIAAATGYLAALVAIDGYLILHNKISDKKPNSIEEYRLLIKKHIPLNGKLMSALNTVYDNLHILAYYREGTEVEMVKSGFKSCEKIIEMLYPEK